MKPKTLSEWLVWQESLNPAEIDLGLDRVRAVAQRLELQPPAGRVFTVAGTNGKGSCAATLEAVLRSSELTTGLYSSPHLVCYNERIRINNEAVDDATLVAAFERIEAVRGDDQLTFFEFGTLAALLIFTTRNCAAWILEVGLGGRLDATNLLDADVAIITTVALDHQDWLGDTVEKIAAEKAGIMRADRPVFYADESPPQTIREHANKTGAQLGCYGESYSCTLHADTWSWQGSGICLAQLPWPRGRSQEQVRNQAAALAAIEVCEADLLSEPAKIRAALEQVNLPGRFQEYADDHQWVLDVAHNPQAAGVMRSRLQQLDPQPTTVVIGMLADKQAELYAQQLTDVADRWISCSISTGRGSTAEQLSERLRRVLSQPVETTGSVTEALERARAVTPTGGRIVVCGSFLVVGPALAWLGLY
jgi:dihydrofolate synthase/folylpolyglutamate synthase